MNGQIDEQRDGLRDRSKKEEAYKTKTERERESPPVTADAKKRENTKNSETKEEVARATPARLDPSSLAAQPAQSKKVQHRENTKNRQNTYSNNP